MKMEIPADFREQARSHTIRELRVLYQRSDTTIRRWCGVVGVKAKGVRAKNGIYTLKQWEWIADRYAEGYGIAELARFLGVRWSTVDYRLTLMGRKNRPPLESRREEFLRF